MTISNGKPINDGDRIAVVGIAFPGLQEDLAISKDMDGDVTFIYKTDSIE